MEFGSGKQPISGNAIAVNSDDLPASAVFTTTRSNDEVSHVVCASLHVRFVMCHMLRAYRMYIFK